MRAKYVNESKDIIITLPQNIKWGDYKKELDEVKNNEKVLNFKVTHFPKESKVGNKCYMLHKGQIVGWMSIVGFEEKDFTCETTGKKWSGKFIQRSGEFHTISPIPMKGFRGFKYIK